MRRERVKSAKTIAVRPRCRLQTWFTPSVTLVAPIAGQVRHGGSSPPLWQLLHQQRVKSAKAGQVRHRDACCTNGGSSPPRRAKSAIMTLCCSTSGPSPPRRVKSAIVTLAAPKAGQVPPRRVKSAITALFFCDSAPRSPPQAWGPHLIRPSTKTSNACCGPARPIRRANVSHTTTTATATAVRRGPFFLSFGAPDQTNVLKAVRGECAKAGRERLTQHTASQENRTN